MYLSQPLFVRHAIYLLTYQTPQGPMIFVAFSLGGVIVKQVCGLYQDNLQMDLL